MAARLNLRQQESVREQIKASQLKNYLENHAINGTGAKNANTRVRAALGLLAKCLPDQSTIAHTGADGGPLTVQILRYADDSTPSE